MVYLESMSMHITDSNDIGMYFYSDVCSKAPILNLYFINCDQFSGNYMLKKKEVRLINWKYLVL